MKRKLTDCDNWLVWREKNQPVSALTGKNKGWNKNLAPYSEAVEFCRQNPGYNLGFYFTAGCGWFGVDADGCRNPDTGELTPWYHEMPELRGFRNVSTSGTGVKLICPVDPATPIKRGVRLIDGPGFGDHDPQVEIFTSKYFALTVSELPANLEITEISPAELEPLKDYLGWDLFDVGPRESAAQPGDTTPEQLAVYLSHLDVLEYQSREDWLMILQAAHHATGGSPEGMAEFIKWSAGDPEKFSHEDTVRDWESCRSDVDNPITVATIIYKIPAEHRPKVTPEQDFAEAPEGVATKTETMELKYQLLPERNRTEAYIARLFAAEYHDRLKYVVEWGKWIRWDGQRWALDPEGVYARAYGMALADDLYSSVPKGSDESLLKFVQSMNNHARINNFVSLSKSRPEFYVNHRDLDSQQYLLNLQNCTLDLRTFAPIDHNPENLLTLVADVEYVEGQDCPVWRKVIDDVFEGDQDLIDYVQRLLGYSLNGVPNEEVFPVAYGDGCNGKSTITTAIQGLLGDYSTVLPSELFDSSHNLHPTYVSKLFRRRFAAIAELEEDVVLSEATVKKLTSRDPIETRRMREDPWEFIPSHTSWMSTNHKPQVRGVDRGIWRRIKLIPFTVDLTSRRDDTIPAKLEAERSGILNWLLDGLRKYYERGLRDEPDAVVFATQGYRDGEDALRLFISECLEEKTGESVLCREVYERYGQWGGRLGLQKFYKRMEEHGFKKVRARQGEFKDQWVYENYKTAIVDF